MIWENTKLLLGLFYRPVSTMSRIVDEGHWLYAAICVAALSFVFQVTITSRLYYGYEAVTRTLPDTVTRSPLPTERSRTAPRSVGEDDDEEEAPLPRYVVEHRPLPVVGNNAWKVVSFAPSSFIGTLMGLAVLYVPLLILMVAITGSNGSFGLLLRRDYGPLFTSILMGWVASHLVPTLLAVGMPSIGLQTTLALWVLSAAWFGLMAALAVRMLFGINFGRALLISVIAAVSFVIQPKLFGLVSPLIFSPFLLFYAYAMFRGDIGDIGYSLRQRQGFRRSMEAATINPRDASAHYQLGLIYQHRRQYSEAIQRFQKAVEIDNEEIDAHFQLGRIAREQGRLQDAINYLGVVLSQDEKHSQSEVWREVGATYLAASMFQESKEALATFLERRPYDAEGLYYYGKTLSQLGDLEGAKEVFQRCIDAVKTAPAYRYREQRKWDKLAREQLATRKRSTA